MLDLNKYQSLGAALKDALDRFADKVCLIEADREREKERLTYRDFKERAHPLASALRDAGFSAGDRASIIMTNQSKWLISAYAVLYAGGVLVPLDYKLTPEEQWQLLKHSGATVLITDRTRIGNCAKCFGERSTAQRRACGREALGRISGSR